MDFKEALKNLESFRQEIEKGRTSRGFISTDFDHTKVAILYGKCELIITQILGVQEIMLGANEKSMLKFSNLIEAGYLSSSTVHRYAGYNQLLKVIGRVQQLAEDPAIPVSPASVSQLIQTIRRFRECCQYLHQPPKEERDVQDVIWIMLRSQFDCLEREATLPKFGVKNYRPDFGLPTLTTCVEVKYIGPRTNTSKIQEEILADIPGYLSNISGYTGIIVLVYDAAHKLRDDRQFVQDILKIDGFTDVVVVPGIG